MDPVLRRRLMRRLETLPDDQVYQVLDFIEFLEAKYAEEELRKEATGLQRFGERLEDSLRKRTIGPGTLREAFHLIAAADRVLGGVASAGRDLFGEINGEPGSSDSDAPDGPPPSPASSPTRSSTSGEARGGGSGPQAERGNPGSDPLRGGDDAGEAEEVGRG